MSLTILCMTLAFLAYSPGMASEQKTSTTKILIVVAHPDDEYYFAGFVYRLTHEKHVLVDEIIVTSGEGGSRYADLGEPFYGKSFKNLSDQKALTSTREAEAKSAAKIMGIQDTEFLRVRDFGFTESLAETLKKWDQDAITEKIFQKLKSGHYDGVLMLAPIPVTHGHHKAASVLAIRAAQKIPEEARPFLLGATIDVTTHVFQDEEHASEVKQGRAFQELKEEPLTRVALDPVAYRFDRNQSFGYQKKLSYQIVVNWMIAEHKTQGAFQTSVDRDDVEVIHTFASSGKPALERARQFFNRLR
jgi:LmbE family N-acetylglucosaminyl deacetylase